MISKYVLGRSTTLLALCAWASSSFAAARAADAPTIESILARASANEGSSQAALAQELIDLGIAAVPRLVDVLALESRQAAGLESARSRVVLSAFEAMGAVRWRPVIDERLGSSVRPDLLSAVFAIEGRCGYAQDLRAVIRAAVLDQGVHPTLEFEEATTRVLLRDAGGFAVLDDELRTLATDLRLALVRAVEATKKPKAAQLLARWIDLRRDIRFECLPYLSRLSLSLDKPIQTDVVSPVRVLVESGDGDTLREAILCIGRLEDCAAIPALIRWLHEGEAGIRQDALWALRRITHLGLGDDSVAWNNWYANEMKWWESKSTEAFGLLTRGTKAEKVAILCMISTMHTWRDKLATEVVLALDDPDPNIALMAATELKRLDSRNAAAGLIDALMNQDERVATAAHAALESILKRELPREPAACRDLLAPSR